MPDDQLDNLVRYVRSDLTALFSMEDPSSLVETCEAIEKRLLFLLSDILVDEVQRHSERADVRFISSPHRCFRYDQHSYQIRFNEPDPRKNALQITIVNLDPEISSLEEDCLKIDFPSVLRYKKAHLCVETRMVNMSIQLANAIQCVLETGSRWLEEYIRSTLNNLHTDTSEALYSYLRQILPLEIVQQVWLYAIVDKKGLYIPCSINREEAIKLAKSRRLQVDLSPATIIADFNTRLMEYDFLFAKAAIESGETVAFEWRDASYSGTGFQLVEQSVLQHESYVTQPIIREGKTLLVAGYPAEIQSQVESTIDKYKNEFKHVLENQASLLRKTWKRIRQRGFMSTLSPQHFEYAGRFIRGLTGVTD